ncbi:MAG: GtrA family protein [Steroidobacteraceae bacterium]
MIVQQFLMFALVGTAGFFVDAGTLLFAYHVLGSNLYSGRVLSFLTSATFTWQLNRQLTFRGASRSGNAWKQWLKFLSANAVGGLLNLGVYGVLIARVPMAREHPVLAVACGSIAGLFFNFVASRIVVFRAHHASAP